MPTRSSQPCKPRWSTPRTDRPTYGERAAKIAAALGTPFMPWQQHVADVALEVDPTTGLLVYTDVGLTVPRQSGKTTLVLAKTILRCTGMGANQRSVYTAQSGSDARAKWQDDWLPILDRSPFARTYRKRLTNGHEALVFNNGSIQSLIATTRSSGHGGSIDDATLDEAFAHSDARLEQALGPAMITRPQPQLWIVSTAGTPEESPYLLGKVETGRAAAEAGLTRSVAYFEWSAPDDMDPADPATWWSCMPALGHTQGEAAVQAKFDSMPINEFERAFLNRWKAGTTDPVIPMERWAACLDGASGALDPVCFTFDVSPDRAWSSIGACGARRDALPHVELVEHRPGTAWVASRMAELKATHKPTVVACDPGGPAGSLLADMAAESVEITPISMIEHAQACGRFYDTVMDAQLRHRDHPELVAALDGATKRPLGDAWAWSRRGSSVDISPLVVVSLALWAFDQHRPAPVKARVVSLADALAAHAAQAQPATAPQEA